MGEKGGWEFSFLLDKRVIYIWHRRKSPMWENADAISIAAIRTNGLIFVTIAGQWGGGGGGGRDLSA